MRMAASRRLSQERGEGAGLPQWTVGFPRRITESCSKGTIIVIIMNLCNFLFCTKMSRTLGTGQVNPGVGGVEIYHNR